MVFRPLPIIIEPKIQKYLPDLEPKIGFEMDEIDVTPHFKGSWEFQLEITTANDDRKIDDAIYRCCVGASASPNYSERNSQEMVVRRKLQSCS